MSFVIRHTFARVGRAPSGCLSASWGSTARPAANTASTIAKVQMRRMVITFWPFVVAAGGDRDRVKSEGTPSLFHQRFQAVQVSLHVSRIRREPLVRHLRFTEQGKQELAAPAADNQPHGDVHLGSRRPDYVMIDNAEGIPRCESNLDCSATRIGNPAIVRLPDRFTKSVRPLVPVRRIGGKSYTWLKGRPMRTVIVRDSTVATVDVLPACPIEAGSCSG